jgi:signal transduction histidine kinase
MNFFTVSALINAITSMFLGLFVLARDPRDRSNLTFALFALAVAGWSAAYLPWLWSKDAVSALGWCRIFMAFAIFIPFFYFHFITSFLKIERIERPFIYIGYMFAVIFSIASFSPLFISGVAPELWFQFWPQPGPFFTPFLLIWVFYVLYGTYILGKHFRVATGTLRSQILLIFVGMAGGYAGGISNYFLWYGIPIAPWPNILVSFYVVMVTYAIIKHQLFNVKVIATELFVFTLWIVLFFRLLLVQSLNDQIINGSVLAASVIIGILLIRTVMQEVRQRELIEQQEKDLEIINKQQENLLHFISHEIKGYLTKSEAGFAAIAEGDAGPISPQVGTIASAALTEVRKGVRTVMDILDASNLKKGTMSYKQNVFDFKDVVVKIVEHLKPAIEEKHLSLTMNIAWEVACKVSGDEEKIRDHVVRNLIDNAIKYTPHGTITIEVSRKDNTIRFSVEDSGVGITPEDMSLLFTEGGHGKDSIKVNVHSTGYGLFIAKTIIDKQGGKISAESAGAGKGSRFVVELPAA